MTPPRLLIAGIGNIFLGDDAFGVEVAQRLLRRPVRDGVKVIDFGIRGLDLTYALLDGPEAAILIDAVPRGQAPGTLFVLEPQIDSPELTTLEAHSMDPLKVLKTVAAMGGKLDRVFIVGCEPSPPSLDDDMQMGLSEHIAAAIEPAIELVESLMNQILEQETSYA
jgi:hydrogenase maturation protease